MTTTLEELQRVFFEELDRRIIQLSEQIDNWGNKIMATVADVQAALTTLQTSVANETTVDQSVLTLLTGLVAQVTSLTAQLKTAGTDPVALQAVVDGLTALGTTVNANAASLSAAVAANTPPPVATTAKVSKSQASSRDE